MSRAKQSPAPDLIEAQGPNEGRLFAAIEPSVHHVEGKVCEGRLAAILAPFASEADARAALKAAGAVLR